MSVVNIRLLDLINEIGEKETKNLLADFSCEKDNDVDFFIKKKAIIFEKSDKARTSLLCWVGKNKSEFEIIAYYSLAIKPFNLEGISKSKQKKIRGGSIPKGKKDNNISAILIGQIGRNDNAKTFLSSNVLFTQIFLTINQINLLIGTRIIYLECHNIPELKKIYEKKGFELLKDKNGKPIINHSNNNDYILYIMTTKKLRSILEENKLL